MSFSKHTTSTGFVLPSIHSAPPFFTHQPNPATLATATGYWTRLILAYARHQRLFTLRVDDAQAPGNEWDEILRNERINRKLLPDSLAYILEQLVAQNQAVYDPPKQNRSVLLYWRLPEEWAEVLYEWVVSTGHLNTILTFYEITDPPIKSELTGIPISLLRKAIAVLAKTGRAQIISVADGEGVRFLSR